MTPFLFPQPASIIVADAWYLLLWMLYKKTEENIMAVQQTLESRGCISKTWRPDPASTHDEVWFDNFSDFLYIDFRKSCATCIRIASWNKGLSVERWNNVPQTWLSEEWDPGIPLPLLQHWRDFPMVEFFSEIPKKVMTAISPFKWRQFVLLRMIRHCPETMDLLQSNPVLAWLCADVIAKSELPVQKAREIIMAKRKDICAFAGLPATDSMVRILGKMRADEYTQVLFVILQNLLRDKEKVSRLRFFRKVPTNEIGNLLLRFDYMAWALSTSNKNGVAVWDAMGDNAATKGYGIWSDTFGLGMDLDLRDTKRRLARCKSFEALQHIHDRWSRTLSRDRAVRRAEEFYEKHGTYSFPSPPFPGDADIVPVTTITDLLNEGAEMHNCVGSYAEKVMSGECFIYRVLRPQRATLEISDTGDMHHICQLKLAHNGEPAAETWAKVRYWFAMAIQVSYAAESLFISHTSSSMCLPRPSFP
jgi:hypothetical protein